MLAWPLAGANGGVKGTIMRTSIVCFSIVIVCIPLSSASSQVEIMREAEDDYSGPATMMQRGAASGAKTIWVNKEDDEVSWIIDIPATGDYSLVVRYSNDDLGTLDDISVRVNGTKVGEFESEDTGGGGFGWNVFVNSPEVALGQLDAGAISLSLRLDRHDGFGIEYDKLTLTGSNIQPPLAPQLVSPSDGATGVATNSLLEWNASSGASSYRVQVANNTGFSNPEVDGSGISGTNHQVSNLVEGTTYYWRMRATNIGGNSSWSSTWEFTTLVNTPPAPLLVSPSDGTTGVVTNPLLAWNAASGATSYCVQVATSTGFSNPTVDVAGISGTSHQVSNLAEGTTYYWRVQGSNAGGNSPWSNTWEFITLVIPPPAPSPKILLEGFRDIVTANDFGFNDFSGNVGEINKAGILYGQRNLECAVGDSCWLHFNWDFRISADQEAFTGIFMSLFGLTDTESTFDGQTVERVMFPEHILDLDDIDGALNTPYGSRSLLGLGVELSYSGTDTLDLRIELKDVQDGGRFTRLRIPGSTLPRTYSWNFRDSQSYSSIGQGLDIHRTKTLTFVIERNNFSANIHSPEQGSINIHQIWFTTEQDDIEPQDDQELLDLQALRAYQYFFDWSSRKPNSSDIPQDRSTFGDLLTVGGIGFALPAHIIAVERNWITRNEATTRVLNVLCILDSASAFGYEKIARIGYQGWFYHFLGIDGRRKLNYDFPATQRDESLNTVELSTIDTGIALMGILAAQSYFNSESLQDEIDIRHLAQSIYDRVNWPFMLEPESQQFYLGWKPIENRDGPSFEVRDADGNGSYSGVPSDPATLDFYTDEALIVILLAAGSTTHPVYGDPEVYCALRRTRKKETGPIVTFPGALFTYQFLHAFLNTQTAQFPACQNEDEVNWFENSSLATLKAIDHVLTNPQGFQSYGPTAWGISAAEGPYDAYHAYGAPPIAYNNNPEEDGTITYYAMLSAVSFGNDLREKATLALRNAWKRGHWHPRFGLPDAFNDDISQADPSDTENQILRGTGKWVQPAQFAIDQGPMLLHLENERTGLIWDLLEQNPNIQRAFNRLLKTPSAAIPFSPPNAADSLLKSVVLKWHSSTGSTFYQLQLSDNQAFSTTFLDTIGITDTTFTVDELEESKTYFWRLRAGNEFGKSAWSEVFKFSTTIPNSVEDIPGNIPDKFSLKQNYPNPFNPETTIQYELPRSASVKLRIYNLAGQRVATLVDEQQIPGAYSVKWSGKDDFDRNVASGVYLYRLESKEFSQVGKLILLR